MLSKIFLHQKIMLHYLTKLSFYMMMILNYFSWKEINWFFRFSPYIRWDIFIYFLFDILAIALAYSCFKSGAHATVALPCYNWRLKLVEVFFNHIHIIQNVGRGCWWNFWEARVDNYILEFEKQLKSGALLLKDGNSNLLADGAIKVLLCVNVSFFT